MTKQKYADELSGIGVARFGNRWNSKGTEIIYTADSRALAMAEVVVHLSLNMIPSDYVMMEINIADEISIEEVIPGSLPLNWNSHPPSVKTQAIGDHFITLRKYCLLKVPSAVVPGDFNILINPNHKDFHRVQIGRVSPFPFDTRIFK